MMRIITAVFVAGAVAGCAVSAAAQAKALQPGPAEPVTITGTVTAVIGIPDAEGTVGVHLTVANDETTYKVHLGPAMFIGMANFFFIVDDEVEIVGKRLPGRGSSFIAQAITRAGRTLTLRDEDGAPAWTSGSEGVDGCGVAHDEEFVGSE